MLHTKIVLNFPNTSTQIKAELNEPISKINAVLHDASTMINVIASGLSNSVDFKYLSTESIFAFTSNEVFANTIKSFGIDNVITFDTPKASAVMLKNINNLTSDIVLSSLLIASIELMFEVVQALGVRSRLFVASTKTANINNQINYSEEINFILQKLVKIANQIGISSEVKITLSKWATAQADFQFTINSPTTILDKQISSTSQFGFGSTANAIIENVVERLRTLFDIDSLTLSNIDNWTMAEFDKTL